MPAPAPLLRLQYSEISGAGLLPLQGSKVLQLLDLRQAHGPYAHYPDRRKYWDGEALLQLLESLREPVDGRGRHVFMPLEMQPDSVGHPWVDLVGDKALDRRIRNAFITLNVMGNLSCSACKDDKDDEDDEDDEEDEEDKNNGGWRG